MAGRARAVESGGSDCQQVLEVIFSSKSLTACMSLIDNDLSGPIGKIKHFFGALNPKLN